MSNYVIKVENLSKRYELRHHYERQKYVAMRDVITDKAKRLRSWLLGRGQNLSSRNGTTPKTLIPNTRNLIPDTGSEHSEPLTSHASRLTASTEDFWALKDVSFEVTQGEVLGIIGRNGAGKSTLLKILSRITKPTEGQVCIRGRVASLLEVGTGFHPELTGRENIFLNGAILGMTTSEIVKKFDEIVAFAEIETFIDTPVKRYSSGMYVRLAFAVAAHLEPELLLVDEVLAVGDSRFQQKCLGKMDEVARDGRTVIFVSHNMGVVRALCKTGLYLSNGRLQNVDAIDKVLTKYCYSEPKVNKKYYPPSSPLKWVEAKQCGRRITISAHYRDLNKQLKIPGLGFVVSDMMGQRLFGHNPMLEPIIVPSDSNIGGGIVVASIEDPVLLDGQYSVSIWFGDDFTGLFHDPDCITFEIAGMAMGKQLPPHKVGSVYPRCTYEFIVPDDPRFSHLDETETRITYARSLL